MLKSKTIFLVTTFVLVFMLSACGSVVQSLESYSKASTPETESAEHFCGLLC